MPSKNPGFSPWAFFGREFRASISSRMRLAAAEAHPLSILYGPTKSRALIQNQYSKP
jgi:hypothetical protein